MVRPPSVDSNGMKKGAWSEEEDNKLRAYIQRYGHWNWRLIPKYAGLARCGKSCRLRWVNYLKPGVKRGSFSKHEEDLIRELHDKLGNRWSAIARKLPGRTDNEIKNFWHTRIKKRIKQSQYVAEFKAHTDSEHSNAQTFQGERYYEITQKDHFHPESHDNSLSSPDLSVLPHRIGNDDLSVINSSDSVAEPIQGDFWRQVLTSNTCHSESENSYFWPQQVGGVYGLQDFDSGMNLF